MKPVKALCKSLWACLLLASLSAPGWAEAIDARILPTFKRFYPSGQLAQLEAPGYALRSANLTWLQPEQKPKLVLGYHRAVPMPSHGVTLHFSSLVRHEPQSKSVKANFRCQKDYRQQTVQHARFGPYVLCSKALDTSPHASKAGAGNLRHVIASAQPLPSNLLPHVTLSLHGFEGDILPLLASLRL